MTRARLDLDEALEEARRAPRTKPGDLWVLGDHRLVCGDATKADDVARLLDGATPKLLTTDPPYGVSLDGSWRDGVYNALGPAEKTYMRVSGQPDADDATGSPGGSDSCSWHLRQPRAGPTARPILPCMRGNSELGTVPAQRRGFGDRQATTARLRHAWRLLAFAIVASAAVVFVLEIIGEVVLGSGRVAIDYRTYIPAAQSWLDGDGFYRSWQLAGPYQLVNPAVMYPPTALVLFVPAVFLPPLGWWLVPAALTVIGLWGARPPTWRWPFIAICLLYPNTLWLVLSGNPDIWAVAFLALATRWPASSAWIVLKPTLAPLAVLGMRTRRWWLFVAALTIVSAALVLMWRDYVVVLMNARGDRATFLWVVYETPLLAIPLLVGWNGPRGRGSDRTVSASVDRPRTARDEVWRGLTP